MQDQQLIRAVLEQVLADTTPPSKLDEAAQAVAEALEHGAP